MKLLKKLALVSAVAAVSSSAFALEQLNDKELANKTAQDGITITITPDSTTGVTIEKLYVHDNDGLAKDKKYKYNGTDVNLGGTYDSAVTTDPNNAAAGAIIVDNLKIKGSTGSNITVDVDTDAGAGNPFINAGVKMNGTTTISLDGVSVGDSKNTAPTTIGTGTDAYKTYTGANQRGVETNTKKILGGLSLSIADAGLNVQLGSQPQGAMVLMDATITNGLKIDGLELVDSNGKKNDNTTTDQGALYVKQAVLTNADSKDLSLAQKINISKADGLVIEMNSPTKGFYGYLTDVGFSDGNGAVQNTIGDVEIVGLKMGKSTIAIKGH